MINQTRCQSGQKRIVKYMFIGNVFFFACTLLVMLRFSQPPSSPPSTRFSPRQLVALRVLMSPQKQQLTIWSIGHPSTTKRFVQIAEGNLNPILIRTLRHSSPRAMQYPNGVTSPSNYPPSIPTARHLSQSLQATALVMNCRLSASVMK